MERQNENLRKLFESHYTWIEGFNRNVRRYYDILNWVTQPQLEGNRVAESSLHVPGVNRTIPREEPGRL